MSHKQLIKMMPTCCSLILLLLIAAEQLQHQQVHASYLIHSSQQMQSYSQQAPNAFNTQQQQQQEQIMQQQQPNIIPFTFNQNVQENQRALVVCTTASGEMPVTFSWLKDSQPLTPQMAQARRIQVKSDQDSSTLKISTVRLEHAGNYTCMAKNHYGSNMYTAQLVVLGEPRWFKEPHAEPIVATRGQTIVIDCQTIGYPRPQQTWQIKTHTAGEFEPLANISNVNGRVSLASNGSLVIRNADKSDEANYLCKSSNGIGKGISWSTSLKVTVPAHFEAKQQPPQTISIKKGQQVQLRCDAYGDQPISIEWFKDNKPLVQQHQPQQHQQQPWFMQHQQQLDGAQTVGDVRYSIHSNNNPLRNGLISQLLIKQAQRNDNSIYECVTKNVHGRDRLTMELVVQEEPDNIQELQLGQMSSRSVTLMWKEPYDGRSSITSYMFQYKRIGVVNDAQLGDSLNDFMESSNSGDQLIAAPHRQGSQQVASYKSPLPLDSDWQHASRIVLPMQVNASQQNSVKSITIEKLEPSSKYVLRALAENANGQSKFSQPMEFNTDEEAPQVGPVNIRAEPINSTSIQVSWEEIPRSKHTGRIHGYYIGYRVANNNSAAANFIYKPYIINDSGAASVAASTASTNGGQQQQSALLTGQLQQSSEQPLVNGQPRLGTAIHELRRDTVYEITVVAFNSRGSGPSSDFVICKTIEMEAPKPVKLTIRRESNESIFIEWQRDATDQNPVDDYVLYQEKNSASQEWLQVRLPGNQTQYKAPGLKCGTRYQFYITAHNKVGKSAPSEVVSASTSGALPVIPSKTSLIKMLNSTCLLINLNSFQDNGCRIKTFTVRYRVERQREQLGSDNLIASGLQQVVINNGGNQASGSAAIGAGVNGGSSGQIIGSNGMSPSHQALTAASQLGGKTVLAGQTASSSGPYTSEWIAIRPKSNIKQQRANEEDRMEHLCDLSPVGEYTIHVAATNDVGRSEIEYSVLMSSDELRHSALKEMLEALSSLSNVFAYIPSMIVFLLAGLLLAIVSLILYTTAMKYYQKFVIMQNQMRATRRAKADERRRRKLTNGMNQSRHSQKMAELWAEEYEEENELEGEEVDEEEELDEEELDEQHHRVNGARPGVLDVDGDDEDDGTATDELQSTSSSSSANGSNAAIHRRSSSNFKVRGRAAARPNGRALTRGHSHLSHQTLRSSHLDYQSPQHLHHHHQYSSSHLAQQQQQQQRRQHSHYLSNIANSAFDTSSIDSPCNSNNLKQGSTCLSTASTDSILNGRFQCLNAKQYVKMNEYTMLPTISASLSPAQGGAAAAAANDIYGSVAMRQVQQQRSQHSSPAHQYRSSGTSPSGNSLSSASNNTSSTTVGNNNNNNTNNSSSLYYSTLRRTNMQTYLPQQHRNQTATLTRGGQPMSQQQNLADIYGYYIAPQQQQQQAQAQGQPTTGQVRAQAQQAQVAAAAAAAAAQQAANEAANSIFVPPQQIIYSAPNIRRQPPVFL